MSKTHWSQILAVAGIAGVLFAGAAWPGRAQNDGIDIFKWTRISARGVDNSGFPSMGAMPTSDADAQKSDRFRVASMTRGDRPSKLLLTDYLPPIGNQGAQGSCVAWSTAYYTYTYEVARQLRLTPEQFSEAKFEFSPAFIYNQCKINGREGMAPAQAFSLLKLHGCATLAEMPYTDKDSSAQPDEAAMKRASKYLARNVGMLFRGKIAHGDGPDLEKLKTYLLEMHQPFVMVIPIFADFPSRPVEPNFVYNVTCEMNQQNFKGLHAITIVGYDDDLHAFRMVNSWGPRWGDNGFLWLSDQFVQNLAVEAWGCPAPGGPIMRGPDGKTKLSAHITLTPAPKTRPIFRGSGANAAPGQ